MNKNTDPDIVTISDDSDVEIIQKVDNSPRHDLQNWPVQSPRRNPKRKKSKVNKSENLPDLDNLSQEELDEYLSQVKGQIEEYNEECKATGQIGLQLQAIAADTGSLFEDTSTEKYDYDKSKIKNETPEEDDIEFLEVKGRSKDVKGVELKRKSVSDLAKRKVRKKSDGKLALAKPRLVPRITSKTPISPMGGEKAEKAIPSSFQRVKKVKPKIEDSYIEEELASMSHSGVDEYLQHLQKPKIKSTVDKPVIKKKPKPPVEKPSSDEKMETKLPEIENIPPSLTGSLRKIMQMTAHTPEEKFKVLDARDKLYKIMRDKDPSLKRGALAGTCPDMCPEKERLMREFQYQVSIFEMVNYPKNTALDHKLAVKQYSRSSADQEEPLPHELRPINVLTMTMNYLLHNIVDYCELADENLEDWYMFMWDRTRALRKELTQQGIHNVETVTLVEQCARFHIHCAERLVDQDSAVYDDKINTENLTKCLQTLKYMYKDLANLDIYCQNEPEFVCYSLLLNLNNTSVFTELSDMSERVMMSSPVRFALDIMAAWETRNYIRFFNLVKRTSYLNGCLLRRYFNEMRLYATKTMIRSYCTKNYSPQMAISRFTENLNFEGEEECQKFLEHCNFTVYRADDGLVTVNFDRLSFQNPETPFPASRAYIFIEDKKQAPLSVIMAGGFLPPKSYENHVPQSSFTASGELKLDSLLCMDLMEFANMPPPPPPPPLIRDMSKPPPLITKPTSALTIFSEMLTKAQKTSSRDPRLREPEPAPIFPAMEEKPPTNVFTSNIFGQKSEGEPQKSIFGQKPDSTSHSIFSKPETTTNSLFAKPEASTNPLFSKPETSSNLLFSKPETSATSIFGQKSQENSNFLFGQKTETTTPIFGQKPPTVSNPIFAPKQDANPILAQNSNGTIFGQNTSSSIFNQKSVTSTSSNIFGNVAKNIFSSGDNHVTSTSASLFPKADKGIFSSAVNKPSVFSNEPKNIFARLGPPQPATFSNFQFKPSVDPEEEKKKEELALQEKLEKEREEMERKRKEEEEEARRKREAEEIRRRKEAEEAQRLELMLLEQKRKLEEERERKERERREIERRQEEERLRKLEAERRERERIQREEQARLEKLRRAEMERLEKIRRIEEEKRQAEIAYQKKIEAKCKDLKEKYLQWKTKIWIEKWRMKAWNLIEERKMRMYQEERKLKYPPVCTEEVLNGNPYGLVIPSVLVLESYSTRRPKISKNENRRENIIIHELPVIKVHRIVGRLLEKRVKKSFGKNNSSFPWKLVLSVPDESEAGEFSKHIETFVEMHFVDNFNWQFGKQGGPLYCNEHCLNAFRYGVCLRRIRGCDLYEGEEYNPKAACGSNGLVFLMTDDKENVRIAAKRLRNVLLARPPLPKIPVVIFVLGNQIDEENLIKSLNLNRWRESHLSEYYIFKCAGKSQEELAIQLIQCVKCIAENSAPISPIQCSKLSNFLSSSNFFDSIWRRMDTSLSNYKIILKEPKFLIEYYNTCIDRLGEHFLDDAYEEYTLSGDEFKSTQSDRPERDEIYTRELLNALEALKLPQWPKEIPKSSHQLNYRIHQYCKKIGNQEKPKIRNIKWILYRIIRRSLLWKGLDIYCDEDINDILLHFPWTQVFQELSRSLLNQYIEKYQTREDVAVIYDTEKLEQLSFECSLIGKFLQKSKRQSNLPNFEEDWNPHLENDSIIYAYTSAIERESSKRKRDSSIDENLDALFSSPAGKRQVLEQDEVPAILNDYSELKTDFQSLSDKLDELQKRINENKKILIETNNMLQ